MPIFKNAARAMRCMPWLVLSACGGFVDDDGRSIDGGVAVAEQPLVVASSMPPTRSTITTAIPRLYADREDVPAGRITAHTDINVAPKSSRSAWLSAVTGDIHKTSAPLNAKLSEAFVRADALRARRAEQWEGVMEDLQDLALVLEIPQPTINPEQPRFFGYEPEHARWLAAEQTTDGAIRSFAAPSSFGELRQRGARLYCAAKEAHARSGGASRAMGRKTLATISLLGQDIDLLSLEPMIALAAPEKFASTANDGAQAFMIPLTIGTRISPISLAPSLPELRTGVGFVTADSETITLSKPANAPQKWWQTATHLDAFVSTSQTASIDPIPETLFTIGPVQVQLDMYFDIHTHSCSQATGVNRIEQCAEAPHQRAHRLLRGAYGSAPTRKGRTAGEVGDALYDDNFWTRSAAGGVGYIGGSELEAVSLNAVDSPSSIRMVQNNDKSLEVRTGVFAELELQAGAAGQLGPFFVEVSMAGGINAHADVVHTVREQMGATERTVLDANSGDTPVPRWYGETSLSVTPSTEASIYADILGTILVTVDLPFIGVTSIGYLNADATLPVTSSNSNGWDEENRLRISTTTTHAQRSVLESHWPAPRNETAMSFVAQPDSISACLADDAPTGGLSGPCESVPGDYPSRTKVTPPHADLCVEASTPRPDWQREDPLRACHFALADFVRGGTSKVVPGTVFRTRVLNAASANAFKSALDVCARSLRSAGRIQALVDIRLCTPDASAPANPLTVTPRLNGEATLEANACR